VIGRRQILIGTLGAAIVLAAAAEHLGRRAVERRYRGAVADRQQLEQDVRGVLAAHDELTGELDRERERSRELSEALSAARAELEEAHASLADERRAARELEIQLASSQRQMEQLQGELAVSLEEARRQPEPAGPVQLERVVVSDGRAPGLQGRVMSIHEDWGFIVVDLGWDTVRIGDTLSVVRGEALLAKARVERVQEGVCAATILPEWKAAQIQVNDLVRIL